MKARAALDDAVGVLVEQLEKIPLARQQLAEQHRLFLLARSRYKCTSAHKRAPARAFAFRDNRGRTNRTGVDRAIDSDPQTASAADDSRPCCSCASSCAGAASGCLFAPTSFVVAAGSIVWIRGANGQGKTTLLRTLAGLSGAGRRRDRRGADAPALAPRPLYLAHANALKEDLTVAESLRFLLHLGRQRASTAADVDAALARFGLASRRDAFVRTLSQGPAPPRRAGAPGGASASSRPWLLDEPFDALDAARRRRARRGDRRAHAARRQRRPHQPPVAADRRPGARSIVDLREPALA